MVRKMGRRAAEAKQTTVPVVVKVSDGEGAADNHTDNGGDISTEADVAREQFPFIFNLLRGHAISTQGPAAHVAGQVRSKTSPAQHQQGEQLQQARKTAAVATCRQHQATPPGRGTQCSKHASSLYILSQEASGRGRRES